MDVKGIIFDFNGTLYWDSHLHYEAWREYSKILRGYEFSDEEMREIALLENLQRENLSSIELLAVSIITSAFILLSFIFLSISNPFIFGNITSRRIKS